MSRILCLSWSLPKKSIYIVYIYAEYGMRIISPQEEEKYLNVYFFKEKKRTRSRHILTLRRKKNLIHSHWHQTDTLRGNVYVYVNVNDACVEEPCS